MTHRNNLSGELVAVKYMVHADYVLSRTCKFFNKIYLDGG